MTTADEEIQMDTHDEMHKAGHDPKHKGPAQPTAQISTQKGDKFAPANLETEPLIQSGLPPELWVIVQSTPGNFVPQYFLEVSRSLLENPNLTASHLSRAELSYQSFTDASYNPLATHSHELASIVKHMKIDHQPIIVSGGYPGYSLEWTVVRKLIPRNPKLDQPLVQTCHLYTSNSNVDIPDSSGFSNSVEAERYLVIYFPHASDPEAIPFYHPKVKGLAILYTYFPNASTEIRQGTLSIYYQLFPSYPLDNRLSRTALKMLQIIHKHSRGLQAGYQKRVHHDVIIPQKPFQDTYAYLKGKYAQKLMENWVEQTLAQKHVFEDLGIAAFLIELWTEMYGGDLTSKVSDLNLDDEDQKLDLPTKKRQAAQNSFPGFVDIGCGNGLLVWILNEEGWSGWGFDARRRKTWDTFDTTKYASKLQEMLLIPEILNTTPNDPTEPPALQTEDPTTTSTPTALKPKTHNGIFPPSTFLIANHADELTPWTPLLSHLSSSPFLAIPCCSHDLSGSRYRFPFVPCPNLDFQPGKGADKSSGVGAGKQHSAYTSFCSYVAGLAGRCGFEVEKENLRTPSTRNVGLIGRRWGKGEIGEGTAEEKLKVLGELVVREMGGASLEDVKARWVGRGEVLMKPGKGAGH